MKFTFSISNILIIISAIFTGLAIFFDNLFILWMNNIFLNSWDYHIFFLQFFTWVFLHWWIFHLFANSIFLYLFWNILEIIMWKNKYIIFFIFIAIFNGILLSVFTTWNTIWISGFCMALLAYYTLELKSKNNQEYKWWITALVLNIGIWLIPWISLLWHLFWAIWWVVFYFITKEYLRRKMIWAVS